MTIDELAEMSEPESDKWINDWDNIERIRELVAADVIVTIDDLSRTELRELLTDAMLHGTTTFHTGGTGPVDSMSPDDLRAEIKRLLDYWRG